MAFLLGAGGLVILAAAIWALPAYLLHVLLHEMAHALTGRFFGYGVSKLSVLPERIDGRWVFGGTEFDRPPFGIGGAIVLAAPAVLETLWCIGAALAFRFASGAVRGVLAVEIVAALIDLSVWCLGAWTRRGDAVGAEVCAELQDKSSRWASLLVPFAGGSALALVLT